MREILSKLQELAEQKPDNLYQLTLEASQAHPAISNRLTEAMRRLNIAMKRELMDEYQVQLAYRLTVKNLVKELQEQETEVSE